MNMNSINSQISYNNSLIKSLQNRNTILKYNISKDLPKDLPLYDNAEQNNIDKRNETNKLIEDWLEGNIKDYSGNTPPMDTDEMLDKINEHIEQKNNNLYSRSNSSELESIIPCTTIENQSIPDIIPSNMTTKVDLFKLLGIPKESY